MARGIAICPDIRNLIIKKFNSKFSLGKISKDLNLPRSTIFSIIKNYKKTESISPKKQKHGRKTKITNRDIRQLERIIKTERRTNVRNLSLEWSKTIGKNVGREWTRIHLHKLKYKFYKAKKKPLLTSLQKKKRLSWAKERRLWVQRQWDSIIFSDESTFHVCLGNSKRDVIRKQNEAFHRDCLQRQVKAPAKIMVWGCMSAKGVGNLHFIDGTVKSSDYVQILENNLLPSVTNLCNVSEYIFQQDGAAPHTARLTKTWLQNNDIPVLEWPSSSPDLNPIESLWGIMKKKLRNDPQRTVNGLKQKIKEIWDSISPEDCQKLVRTMPNRLNEVIKAKGDVTKY